MGLSGIAPHLVPWLERTSKQLGLGGIAPLLCGSGGNRGLGRELPLCSFSCWMILLSYVDSVDPRESSTTVMM